MSIVEISLESCGKSDIVSQWVRRENSREYAQFPKPWHYHQNRVRVGERARILGMGVEKWSQCRHRKFIKESICMLGRMNFHCVSPIFFVLEFSFLISEAKSTTMMIEGIVAVTRKPTDWREDPFDCGIEWRGKRRLSRWSWKRVPTRRPNSASYSLSLLRLLSRIRKGILWSRSKSSFPCSRAPCFHGNKLICGTQDDFSGHRHCPTHSNSAWSGISPLYQRSPSPIPMIWFSFSGRPRGRDKRRRWRIGWRRWEREWPCRKRGILDDASRRRVAQLLKWVGERLRRRWCRR